MLPRPALAALAVVIGGSLSLRVAAEPRASPASTSASTRSGGAAAPRPPAQEHFQRALASYERGEYRAAVTDLEAALALEPEGRDLLFNLALVHEKLAEYGRAIAYLRRLRALEDDPNEQRSLDRTMRRLEGAERAATDARAAHVGATARGGPVRAGRMDGWVVGSLVVAAAATAVGAVYTARALTAPEDEPSSRRDAIRADLAFSLAIVGGTAAGVLYLTREPSDRAALRPGSVGLCVRGRF